MRGSARRRRALPPRLALGITKIARGLLLRLQFFIRYFVPLFLFGSKARVFCLLGRFFGREAVTLGGGFRFCGGTACFFFGREACFFRFTSSFFRRPSRFAFVSRNGKRLTFGAARGDRRVVGVGARFESFEDGLFGGGGALQPVVQVTALERAFVAATISFGGFHDSLSRDVFRAIREPACPTSLGQQGANNAFTARAGLFEHNATIGRVKAMGAPFCGARGDKDALRFEIDIRKVRFEDPARTPMCGRFPPVQKSA